MHALWSCWRLHIRIQAECFLSQPGRGNLLGISSTREVSHGGNGWPSAAATCGGSALLQICSPSYQPLPGCEPIAAGGLGGRGGETLPSFRCWTQLVASARPHPPSSAINQVARMSLISYGGEQPEEAAEHRRPRKSGHGAASRGRRASAPRPLCCSNVTFIFIHHPSACQVHTDQKFALEICGFSHAGTNISEGLVLHKQAHLASSLGQRFSFSETQSESRISFLFCW